MSFIALYTPHGKPKMGLNGTLSRDMEIQQKEEEEGKKKEVDCLTNIRTSG